MQVSVEKTSELSRKMTVSVPEAIVQEKMAARLKTLAREVKVDGFRPGKAPQHVVKQMYGDRVRNEVAGDLIQSTYFEALQNQDLKPAGYPHIQQAEDDSEGFKYTATFEIYPDISLEGLDELSVVRPIAAIASSDIDAMVDKLRSQKKTWQTVDRVSQENDRVTISFSGVSEGENFTDGKVEGYPVEIGGKQMIPGFEDNLTGLSVGSTKVFSLTFPEQYGNEKLAGKLAEFDIEVTGLEEAVLPEVNEEFIKAYGIEDGTIEAFMDDVKANMERELNQALRGKLKNAVMDALYEKVPILLPNTLVDQEIESMLKPYQETAKKQKMKLEDLNLSRVVFEGQAKRRVALGLILGEIIDKNSIKLDDSKVRLSIEDMAKSYERPEDVINWYYAEEQRLSEVKQVVLEEQVVEWLVAKAKVSEQTMSFSEVMDK
ncbi:MAG: trigger factor [Methylococcaceae bacterium]|jgi:trigger factor